MDPKDPKATGLLEDGGMLEEVGEATGPATPPSSFSIGNHVKGPIEVHAPDQSSRKRRFDAGAGPDMTAAGNPRRIALIGVPTDVGAADRGGPPIKR